MYHMIAAFLMLSAGEPYLDRDMGAWVDAGPRPLKVAIREVALEAGLFSPAVEEFPSPDDKTQYTWQSAVNVMRHRGQGRKVFAGPTTPVP